ncbi:Ldh family oxidoreductase [Georgenia sp. SYP-B2076]|uniref:Ldh family oxidoreductase n=1 Tax=Georgenia sp. SYP-B2076 TaxID=2495881 RepID=UPI00197A950A|nr:Ldh family oxidoreductase [Georgenia sp. SYP-B2076]
MTAQTDDIPTPTGEAAPPGQAATKAALRRFHPEVVRAQILAVLDAWGMPEDLAAVSADVMVDTDLAGIDSHGISMLPSYQGLVDEGRMDIAARPLVVHETATTALLDAQDGLGHPTTAEAMALAVAKARTAGMGAVAVHRSHHFGAAGYYARIAADAGMVGLVTTTTRARAVVPTRGSTPLLGTNPIAFAAPTTDPERPFLLDMSTSSVAVNKVKVYDFLDKPLPAGWVLDGQGLPVTDPHAAHARLRAQEEGGLTPLGGTEALSSHKGYGLGVMVQILAGALSGALFAPEKGRPGPDDIGHFCLAIDPAAFGGAETFRPAVSEIVDTLHVHPSTSPDRPVLVAGDPERLARAERSEHGIPISDALLDLLAGICTAAGADFLLEGA